MIVRVYAITASPVNAYMPDHRQMAALCVWCVNPPAGPTLQGVLFGAGDDFVLEVAAEVDEVVAVAGDADDQVAVLLGVLLGLAEGLGVDAKAATALIDSARRKITLAADYHRDEELGRAIERHNQLYEMAVQQDDPNAGRAIERERCRLLDLFPKPHQPTQPGQGPTEAEAELERIVGYLEPLGLAPTGTPAAELVRLTVEKSLDA